jgi:hypothetical protein
MDTLMGLDHDLVVRPGHTDPTTIGEEWEHNPFVRLWRGLDEEGSEEITVWDQPATLVLEGPDYDGGTKAWVRWEDGSDDIVPGSQVQRPGRAAIRMARDRDPIPTSRIGRLNKIGRLAAGPGRPAVRHAAANVVRDDESSQAALERRQIAAAEQIVTVLGTMKGAAMKLGQVLSFLDVGLVPESYREEFQAKLAELRDAAPKVSFKDMKRVLEGEYGDSSTRSSRRSTRCRSPPPRSARSTRRRCPTGATSRSRCSTPAWRPRSAPTCRTSG